jgi:hypothetical protein
MRAITDRVPRRPNAVSDLWYLEDLPMKSVTSASTVHNFPLNW